MSGIRGKDGGSGEGIQVLTPWQIVRRVVLVVIVAVAALLLRAWVVMILWNATIPVIYCGRIGKLQFVHALSMSVLFSLLCWRTV